ncbi:hypothetical protein HY02_08200 [Peptococcaceae bacterium SCADC1_2_3]|nr:hypothetical protein DK28_0212675 [Peptococcaceae bacterium SCADC1_2_3]KFI35073.1 hypothetical protein HY00_07815 [Peptococcaceae bacterium SCADC1_2_3]KFI37307.1 hypothetical protein HY02_08200 [Peptococcaceae bacterium SCADC1_2_3]
MKTILIRRVNVISVLRSTLSPLVIIGLAAGVLMGIFLIISSSFHKESVSHIGWNEIIGITLIMGAKGFLASLALTLAALLFNVFYSFNGGIRVEVETVEVETDDNIKNRMEGEGDD